MWGSISENKLIKATIQSSVHTKVVSVSGVTGSWSGRLARECRGKMVREGRGGGIVGGWIGSKA